MSQLLDFFQRDLLANGTMKIGTFFCGSWDMLLKVEIGSSFSNHKIIVKANT